MGERQQNKSLGLSWYSNSDELHFTTRIENTPKLTKRVILSVISQIYDPCLLAPAVILSKIVLQKLWFSKIDWDDSVPDDVIDTGHSFVGMLDSLQNLRVSRCLRSEYTQQPELHIFSNAFQVAYSR